MSTREENLKKINEELEKLSDEELEKVAGGTNGEYFELANLLPKVKRGHFGGKIVREEIVSKAELTSWLKENLNIDANISTKSSIFAEGGEDFYSLGNANTYVRNGENLSHSSVVAEVKNFFNAQ